MILDQIIKDSRLELEDKKNKLPLEKIKEKIADLPHARDFGLALRGESIKLIAEVKKASPSRGIICPDFNHLKIAEAYANNGAAAISVLTETRYFQGSLHYLRDIKEKLINHTIPLMRKDFIYDTYQVYESRYFGADCLLLIAAALTTEKLYELIELTHKLGMECLVEIHNKKELDTVLDSNAGIIGINNRDLSTFTVDLNTTQYLRTLIPRDRVIVSESGIKTHNDIELIKNWQVDAVLIGEALVSASDIAIKIKELF
ncbi:MAG: indole-3-glycerol phosphate synthase TrpC [Dehalococcoidales bacterium]|nr:indole-3-glycerol phosphate synthase TrpC [Dehalococcoidales bacterium]